MRRWLSVSARTTRQKRIQSIDDDGDDHRVQPGAEHGDQQDREEHRRERHPDVDDARDDLVEPAAIVAGEQAEDRADEAGGGRGDEGDGQRDAAAVDEAREHVAAEAVGAEQVAGLRAGEPGRRQRAEHQVLRQRIVRRDQRREERATSTTIASHEPDEDQPPGARRAADARPPQPWRSRGLSSA